MSEAKAKTGATICSLEDLTFPVELRDNPRATNQEYSKVVTGIINGVETDLNYCSPRYELVPNEMIFPKVEEILETEDIAYSVEYSHTQNARFYGNFTIEDKRFSYKMKGTGDAIKFRWNFQHSYNGLTKYKGIAGFFRLVCSNGLIIPVHEMNEHNLCIQGKHTSAILNSLANLNDILINFSDNRNDVKKSIVRKYEMLGGRVVTELEDRVTEVLKATKIPIVETAKYNSLDVITGHVLSEANGDTPETAKLKYNGRVNDWLVYNGINQYIHDDSRNIASPEKRRETDSKVLEYMLEYA